MQRQVIRAAGFGVRTGHLEAAERLVADNRSCTASVEVQVADHEIAAGLFDVFAVLRYYRPGQTVIRSVRIFDCLIEVLRRRKADERAEYLFLHDAVIMFQT